MSRRLRPLAAEANSVEQRTAEGRAATPSRVPYTPRQVGTLVALARRNNFASRDLGQKKQRAKAAKVGTLVPPWHAARTRRAG